MVRLQSLFGLLLLWSTRLEAKPFEPRRNSVWQSSRRRVVHHQQQQRSKDASVVETIPRGGGNVVVESVKGLNSYLKGPKTDTLLLLLTTAANAPVCKAIGLSPILGFLLAGLVSGPNGFSWIKDVHTTEMLADIGIVFFLFEMGIHLSLPKLIAMKRTVFGLGGSQFGLTAMAVGLFALLCGMSPAAAVLLGGGLALSSSAFVLQLLKDKDMLATDYGQSAFGILLLQDLMVVPLLVLTPLLAPNGDTSLGAALAKALVQIVLALAAIATMGKFVLPKAFDKVAASQSQESMVGLILTTVLGFSFLTEGLGLSNTLGAFLAGVLLAEHPLVHTIEREASPIRGILVGLFFFTVGFEIDLGLIKRQWPLILSLVTGIVSLKTLLAGTVAKYYGHLPLATAQRLGLVLSQGGEFAFVAFRMARSHGILSSDETKLMLTVVSLSMALTPMLEDYGAGLMKKEEERVAAALAVLQAQEEAARLAALAAEGGKQKKL